MKKSNLQRHYDSCHGNLEKFTGQARQDKIAFLKRGLNAQQTALQKYCKTDNDIIQTSYEISELIAKKLKPHMEREFVKECIVAAAKLIAPEKVAVFEKISLSRRTVSSRIQKMGDNIEKTLKDKAQDFEFFALALDETTDITNTAQLAIFIRGVTSDFFAVETAPSYKCGGSRCNLCLAEKLAILSGDRKMMLNKRSEIVNTCRHRKKFKLKSIRLDGSL